MLDLGLRLFVLAVWIFVIARQVWTKIHITEQREAHEYHVLFHAAFAAVALCVVVIPRYADPPRTAVGLLGDMLTVYVVGTFADNILVGVPQGSEVEFRTRRGESAGRKPAGLRLVPWRTRSVRFYNLALSRAGRNHQAWPQKRTI